MQFITLQDTALDSKCFEPVRKLKWRDPDEMPPVLEMIPDVHLNSIHAEPAQEDLNQPDGEELPENTACNEAPPRRGPTTVPIPSHPANPKQHLQLMKHHSAMP
ncbi:hypothetical protein COOONC_21328 [Cooperia oncophora]